ncbi:MAG: hypothetical protein HUU23_15530 [Caldilineales bacterium]|nr:hypothetical protein [Caldilineales bacterium]
MNADTPNQFILNTEEQEMVDLLREEMGLESSAEVMHLLVRQAIQRIAITCPQCGHFARVTERDQAECRSCLSVITLSEDIWDATRTPAG